MSSKNLIQKFLIIWFLSVVLSLVILEIVSVRQIDKLARQTESMYMHPLIVSNAILEANSDIVRIQQHMKDVVLVGDREALETAISKVNAFELDVYMHLDTAYERFLGDKARIQAVRQAFTEWKNIRADIIKLLRLQKKSQAANITNNIEAKHVASLTQQMDGLIEFARNKAKEFLIASKQTHSASIFEMRLVMLVLLLASGGIGFYIIRKINSADKRRLEIEIEHRFNTKTIESMMEGVAYIQLTNAEIVFANSNFEKIFGYEADEMVGLNGSTLNAGTEEEKHTLATNIMNKINATGGWHGEIKNIKKDGTEFWSYATVSIINHPQFGPIAVTIHSDITRRKLAENALEKSHKLEAVGKLTGGIAHDFNNILSVCLGNLELIEAMEKNNQAVKGRVATAIRSIERGRNLIGKLLKVSRKRSDEVKAISVNNILKSMKGIIERSVTASIQATFHLGENIWSTSIDPEDFEDAILNLTLNARDAMPHGGELTLSTSNENIKDAAFKFGSNSNTIEYVVITIKDTGLGIPSDVCDKIFEPFFTTKDESRGTGLGLNMVQSFVHRSNGHLDVSSVLRQGAIFKIYLPRAEDRLLEVNVSSPKPPPLKGGQETVLVVDDEEDILEITTINLMALGYKVLTANNGPTALDILENNKEIDLLFSDVIMPKGMDGFQLAIQAEQYQPGIKVLLSSGYTGTDSEREALPNHQKHLSNLLRKPYSKREMAKRIRMVLDNETI